MNKSTRAYSVILSVAWLTCFFCGVATAHASTEGKIAFVSNREGGGAIYVMDADGTDQTRITVDPAASDRDPSFSHDGSKIAFTSYRNSRYDIYVMNADGTNQTQLTNDAAIDESPSFSPDGSKIAFVSNRDNVVGNPDIYVMNADGTDQTRLTTNLVTDNLPTFSPDGSKIAFASNRDGNREIYVMNADGTNQTRITTNAATDTDPSFSPDGSKIAFTSYRDGNYEIYVMNADGTNQTRITTNAATDTSPSFSPDGSAIAFTSTRDANQEIYVMNADGTNQTNRTTDAAIDYSPSWGPSSYPIASSAGAGGSISPEDPWVAAGSDQSFLITPDPGYRISDVVVDGMSQGPAGSFTFVNVTSAGHTISATFALNTVGPAAPTVMGPTNVGILVYPREFQGYLTWAAVPTATQYRIVNADTGFTENTVTSTTAMVTGSQGVTRRFYVVAVDAAGNPSPSSNTVTLRYDTVSAPPAPPGNVTLLPSSAFELSSDSGIGSPTGMRAEYDPAEVTGDESRLRLYRYTGSGWADITTSVDTTNHHVYGATDSFSPFAIGMPAASPPTVSTPASSAWSLTLVGILGAALAQIRGRKGRSQ